LLGDPEVRMECLPGSTLPDELRAQLGYDVRDLGDGEHILAVAIVEKFVLNAAGELALLTAGSTRPVTSTVTHAGITKIKRYAFDIP
jgi:hypothetical protein